MAVYTLFGLKIQKSRLSNRLSSNFCARHHVRKNTRPRSKGFSSEVYLEGRNQVEIATALGISQATISQHLTGKRRGSARVGGAFRKIRKAIHKAAKRRAYPDTRFTQIIRTLDDLLDHSITHRRARSLLDTLARSTPQDSGPSSEKIKKI